MSGNGPTTGAGRSRLTSRALLACVILGALGAVIVHASRVLGVALQAGVPWLSFPAPLPWFLGILIAPLLVRRVGAALLTSIVTTVAGFGALALCGGIVVELLFVATVLIRSRLGAGWPPARSPFWLWWASAAALAVSIMSFGFLFLYREFLLLEPGVMALALAVRLVLGAAYAWAAWRIALALLCAGVDPQRIAAA